MGSKMIAKIKVECDRCGGRGKLKHHHENSCYRRYLFANPTLDCKIENIDCWVCDTLGYIFCAGEIVDLHLTPFPYMFISYPDGGYQSFEEYHSYEIHSNIVSLKEYIKILERTLENEIRKKEQIP